MDAHTQRELPSIPLGFDTPFSEHTVVFRVIESNVEVGATAVPISGDQASSSEDWIIVTWDGATLDASLANDPLKR